VENSIDGSGVCPLVMARAARTRPTDSIIDTMKPISEKSSEMMVLPDT